MKLNELREELDNSIKEENFAKAADIKEQIAELECKSEEIKATNQPQNQTIRIEKVIECFVLHYMLLMLLKY